MSLFFDLYTLFVYFFIEIVPEYKSLNFPVTIKTDFLFSRKLANDFFDKIDSGQLAILNFQGFNC